MALSNIEIVRFITQDNGNLPFLKVGDYIVSDEEIDWAIENYNNDVMAAARFCCHIIARWMARVNTKEIVGEVEVWNEVSKQYLNALKEFLNDKTLISVIPKGVIPYAAGVSVSDLYRSYNDPDNPRARTWLYQKKEYDPSSYWYNRCQLQLP